MTGLTEGVGEAEISLNSFSVVIKENIRGKQILMYTLQSDLREPHRMNKLQKFSGIA